MSPAPDDRDDGDHEHEEREGDGNVDEPHDERVEPAAVVAGERTDEHPDHERHVGDDEDHPQVEPDGVDDARGDVATERVRPHGVLDGRRQELRLEVDWFGSYGARSGAKMAVSAAATRIPTPTKKVTFDQRRSDVARLCSAACVREPARDVEAHSAAPRARSVDRSSE